MSFIKINLANSVLIITGLYLLCKNLFLLQGDPFLLYIGLLLTLFFYFKNRIIALLILGIILLGAGVSQILIDNQLTMGLSKELIISTSSGISFICIFIINHNLKNSDNQNSNYYYWPLSLGLILVIASLIYSQGLENYFWEKVQTYWPLFLPCLVFIREKPLSIKKIKAQIKK